MNALLLLEDKHTGLLRENQTPECDPCNESERNRSPLAAMMRARAITAKRLFTKSWFYPVLLFFVVVLFKFPIIKTPHYWDALNRMHNVDWIKHHNFNPFLQLGDGPLNSQGRPPFLLELLALASAIAGSTIAIPHLVIIAFSYLGALFTYYLGLRLFSRRVGVLSSLLLFLSPLYFAQSGIINFAVPLTALSTAAIFYALTENRKKYVFVASCLVLTHETGMLALFPILPIICARYYKTPHCMRKLCVYFLPFIMLAVWLLACKVHLGWYLYPSHIGLLNFSRVSALSAAFIYRTAQLLIVNYHWLLSCFLVLGFILWWNTKRHKHEIIFLICGELIIYLLFFSAYSAEVPRYILPIYPLFYLASIKGMDLVFR